MSDDINRKIRLLSYIVEDSAKLAKGIRADSFLAGISALPSRSQLKIWFSEQRITRRGKVLKASELLFPADEIEIEVPPPKAYALEARPLALDIRYEDEDLVVLYKPRGLVMHPGHDEDDRTTLVHALLYHCQSLSSDPDGVRPGIVHRLDKDTEGLVVVAKNTKVHEHLAEQFSNRTIERAYWSLCWGVPPASFEIEAPIARHPRERKKMAVVDHGRHALTQVERLRTWRFEKEEFSAFSWVKCQLMTGRTHQIRVHLSHQGFSILNDPVYGRTRGKKIHPELKTILASIEGQALVAFRLGFVHPQSGEKLFFESSAPSWLEQVQTIS